MRADRLLGIMLRLQSQDLWTTQDLARALNVSRRTILRDIDALSVAGIPVYTQSGQGGGVMLDENYRVSLTGLREAEVRALYLSGNLKLLADIGLEDASESALLKFFATLPHLQQQMVKHLRQRIYIDSTWWVNEESPPVLPNLLEAVHQNRRLEVRYQYQNGEMVNRILEPYGLVAKGGTWYLVAMREGEFRTYRVSRFQHATLLQTEFLRQPDFDLETFWRANVSDFFESLIHYRFTLKIHPRRRDFIQKYSTGRYDLLDSGDSEGWFTVRFEVETTELALMLIFALGEDTLILDPPELPALMQSRSRLWT